MTTKKSQYYFTALDNYPYNLPECMEALNYALSYDSQDADVLCLMGRVYAEVIQDYEKAKEYFEEAMMCDPANVNTPRHYILCLLHNEDFIEAEKLIAFALNLKGTDKAFLWYCRSLLSDRRGNLRNALFFLLKAEEYCYEKTMLDNLEEHGKLIKAKLSKAEKRLKKIQKMKKETR